MAEVAQPTSPPPGPTAVNGDAANDDKENAVPALSQSENITVFHDVSNFNVKHPLMNTWTLWFTRPPSSKGDNWNDLLKEVVSFDSVEEFWGVYVRIILNSVPSRTLTGSEQYHGLL